MKQMEENANNIISVKVTPNISLKVHKYSGGSKTPVICIPGLTRNARDFEEIAPKIANAGRDVYVFSLRGRAASDYDPNYHNYFPTTYRDDVLTAMEQLNLAQAIFIGTSLGGITTMLVNDNAPDRVRAAIINDVGPELAQEGIKRIEGYVGGTAEPAKDLDEAAARIKAINEVAFPDASDEEWRAFARRTFRQLDNGEWILDYDPNIAKALAESGPAPDLWGPFESLRNTPTLVIRGGISDLLSMEIIEKMRKVHPAFEYVEVPRVGHAPLLTEPEAREAISAFLDAID